MSLSVLPFFYFFIKQSCLSVTQISGCVKNDTRNASFFSVNHDKNALCKVFIILRVCDRNDSQYFELNHNLKHNEAHSACAESTNKGDNETPCTQVQQQRPESLTVTRTLHASNHN